jgi:peptidoglycan hydrolase CwlO-like protein
MKSCRFGVMALAFLLVAGFSSSVYAQAQGNRQGRQRGNQQQGQGQQGQQRGNIDPAQARERYLTQLKEQLGASDEEWKALQPKVEKVLTAQRDNRRGGGGNRGFGRNRNNNNAQQQPNAQPTSEVTAAADELRKTVDDKAATAEDINKKLTALREAREKAKNELTTAQKELRELLSARQEAILVSSGLLD